ncbi:hypothetical protein AX14_004411 [Amanita brunnescens Koide BX004]|nr:hypothetical protein AX14_004411 [Amanita brunnescens Koide BX004]
MLLRVLMDNLLAIGLGLAVRHVVHMVGRGDARMTGTLVGIWEGAVLSHLLRKSRGGLDPLLGYAVRLVADYYVAENFARLVLTIVWTGLGIVLADIAPVLWVDVGLHRYWRRFRRDVHYMSRSMPSVDFFPRARTVRFSPRPTTALLSDSDSTATPISVRPRPHSKRHVPGSFESDTDTVTDAGSVRLRQSELLQPRRRQSVFPSFATVFMDDASEVTSAGHVDEGNISSPLSDGGTEDLSAANPSEIPDELELEYIDAKPEEGTPKQNNMGLPTPTDSLHPFDPMRQEYDFVRPPPPADIRTIPDTYDDWENISKSDADNAPSSQNEQPPAKESPPPQPIPPPGRQKSALPDKPAFTFTQPVLPAKPAPTSTQHVLPAKSAPTFTQHVLPDKPILTFTQQAVLPDKPASTPSCQINPLPLDSLRRYPLTEKPLADTYEFTGPLTKSPSADTYESTGPLTKKPPAGDTAQEHESSAPQGVADEEQAKSEHGEAKSVASDLSQETLDNIKGLECLEQMARLHQFVVKAKEDYESAVQKHRAVQTSGNKERAIQAKTEMDAYERKLKNITNKAEVCYLSHNKSEGKLADEIDLMSFKVKSALEESVRKALQQFLRPSTERNSLRFVTARANKQGAPQREYLIDLTKSLNLRSSTDPNNKRVIIVDK